MGAGDRDEPDAANLAAERLEGILDGMDARVDVSADGRVVVSMAPEVADRLSLDE